MSRSILLSSMLLAAPAQAWAPIDTCGANYTRWWQPTVWELHRSGASPYYTQLSDAEVFDAMNDGFQVWSDASCCSDFQHVFGGDTSAGYSAADNVNAVEFYENSWPGGFGGVNSTIAITLPQYDWNTCEIDNADQAYNAVGFDFTTTNSPGWNDTDLQSITAHEHGHWLGLDHSATSQATMYASYGGGIGSRTLHSDDETGVCTMYPGSCGPTCQMTEVIGCDDSDNGTTVGASNTVSTWACANWATTGPEVTYEFTSTITGDVTIRLTNLNDDLDLFVTDELSGGCDNQSCAASGTAYTADEEVVLPAVAGTTYAIVVDGWDGATSSFSLETDCGGGGTGTGGGGGTCAVTDVVACGDFVSGTTVGGDLDVEAFSCASWPTTGPEKVYSFTPGVSGAVTVRMSGLSQDLDLFVTPEVGGGCDAGGCLGGSQNYDLADEQVVFTASAGTTYTIVADGWDGAASGFDLDVSCPPPPGGGTGTGGGTGGSGTGTGGGSSTGGGGGTGTGGGSTNATGTGTGDPGTSGGTGTGGAVLPPSTELPKGCGCDTRGGAPVGFLLVPLLLGLRRRPQLL